MRKGIIGTSPPENGNSARQSADPKNEYLKNGTPPQGFRPLANLEPGTAIIPPTQGRFTFDSGELFNDPHIVSYLKFLARDLSDEGVRAFLAARFTYERFRKVGTGEARRDAWLYVWLACRLSEKSGGNQYQGTIRKRASGATWRANYPGGPTVSAPTTKGPYEDKRNWAACFRNENKREPWMADYAGAVTLEDGQKFWVNLHEKKDRNGKTYFSVGLKPFQPKPQKDCGKP